MIVFSEKRIYADCRYKTSFKMVTDISPSKEQIAQSQIRLHYHPNGYGEPWGAKTREEDGKFVTIWNCAGSCDMNDNEYKVEMQGGTTAIYWAESALEAKHKAERDGYSVISVFRDMIGHWMRII